MKTLKAIRPKARSLAMMLPLALLTACAGGDETNGVNGNVVPGNGDVLQCDIAVVGGSTAAYSATVAALRDGSKVCLVSPTSMVGGQFTSQGLHASDDGDLQRQDASAGVLSGEEFGFSAMQREFRARSRDLQRSHHASRGETLVRDMRKDPDNLGDCWVADNCGDPASALQAMRDELRPYTASGQLTLIHDSVPTAVETSVVAGKKRVKAIDFRDVVNSTDFTVVPKIVVEATDLGDLLELAGMESRVGQEARADTGESVLGDTACPECQQNITWVALVRRGDDQPVGAPAGFGVEPWLSNYTDTLYFGPTKYDFFDNWGGIFTYRRVVNLGGRGDVSMLNYGCHDDPERGQVCGNDYLDGQLVGVPPEERALHLQRSRDRALGYVHYLQQANLVHKGQNVELSPASDITGTDDGVALEPYIREARRGVALETVVWQDAAKSENPGAKWGRVYNDTVGVGNYHYFDFHAYENNPAHVDLSDAQKEVLPFTIPLGALVPVDAENVILSAKSIGTTHITSAAYRMHPVEWHIGEAGGVLAALADRSGRGIHDIATDDGGIREVQTLLAGHGQPLLWIDDVATSDSDFQAIHSLAAAGVMFLPSMQSHGFQPDAQLTRAQAAEVVFQSLGLSPQTAGGPSFSDVGTDHWAYSYIETLATLRIVSGAGDGTFAPDAPVQRVHLKYMLDAALSNAAVSGLTRSLVDQALAVIPNDGTVAKRREIVRVFYKLWRGLQAANK